MKALLLLSLCLLALTAACGQLASESGSSDSAPHTTAGASTGSAPSSEAAASSAEVDSKLIVTTSVDLEVEVIRDAYVGVARLARDMGGFVADSRLADSDSPGSTAALRLRLPSARHDDFVNALRQFDNAVLKREETTAKEVTAEYTDLQSHLFNLRAGETQYRELLTRAGTIDEVLKVSAKLDEVRREIETTQGRINLIDDLDSLATVNVNLKLPPPVVAQSKGMPSPVEMFSDTVHATYVAGWAALNLLVVVVVTGAWLLPLSIVSLLIWRAGRRRLPAIKSRLLD